jgi:hypothetical protein
MKKYLALLLTLTMGFSAYAEEDILSILNDEAQDSKAAKTVKKDIVIEHGPSPFKVLFGNTTAEQNIFFTLLQSGENEKAILQYFEAFGKSPAFKTSNGQALLSYLFLKNDMAVYGVENLFAQAKPSQISPVLAKALRELLPDGAPVWKLARIEWNPEWTKVFSTAAEVQVKSKKVYTAKDTEYLKELIKISAPDTADRAAIQWQLVLALALNNETVTAAKLLNNLMATKNNPVQMDLMNMTAARFLYENGYMDAAINYYKKVPKKSDLWLEAQEEIAWSYIRKGEAQNTLAITQSLVIPEFKNMVGPETIFVRALGEIKVCDYPSVANSLTMFKERYRPRVVELMKLTQNANTPATKDYIARSKKQRLKLIDLKENAAKLPRLITRDETLAQNIAVEKEMEREADIAAGIYGRSLANGTSKVGLQGELEVFKQMIDTQILKSRNASLGRIKSLAQEEIEDTHRILQKLHIVEAEILQQTLAIQKITKATEKSKEIEKKGTSIAATRDQITFPAEDGQVWFDEIGKYKVDVVKGCQAIKR